MKTYTVENPEGKRLPAWARTAFVDDDGVIFAPAAIAGNERAVLLCAMQDGVPLMSDKGHTYVPTSWIAQEYPSQLGTCLSIERRIRAEI